MSQQHAAHLMAWIAAHVCEAEQFDTWALIDTFCSAHPDLVESRSWSEIRSLAERTL